MMVSTASGQPLSAFAGELFMRVQQRLIDDMGTPGRGAFGRVAQEALEYSMGLLDPFLQRNPGAGVPDCWCSLPSQRCACEVKYTDNGEVTLGKRDIEGMQLGGEADGARLIVLDIEFPPRLWVLDSSHIEPGRLQPSSHAHLHQVDEARLLVEQLERLVRLADVDLIASEAGAKALLVRAAEQLRGQSPSLASPEADASAR